jgi:hypothetical protein
VGPQWNAARLVAVVMVTTIASGGCAKPFASKAYAGEPGILLDSPTGDSPRDLLLGGFAESAVPTGSGVGRPLAGGPWTSRGQRSICAMPHPCTRTATIPP